MDPISLIGIPFDDKSSFLKGAALAPGRIREELASFAYNGFAESGKLVLHEDVVKDLGNITVQEYSQIIPELDMLGAENRKCLFLGGDHSISYPLIKFITQKSPGGVHILHFDAHSDLYEIFEGDKYSHACPFARVLEDGLAASITQVGIRTLTIDQREQIERYQVRVFEMENIKKFHPEDLEGPLYISLDMDVFDPAFAPGISHYEAGGVLSRDLINWLKKIRVPVIGADLVEYNPHRDINGITAALAMKLIKELLDVMSN